MKSKTWSASIAVILSTLFLGEPLYPRPGLAGSLPEGMTSQALTNGAESAEFQFQQETGRIWIRLLRKERSYPSAVELRLLRPDAPPLILQLQPLSPASKDPTYSGSIPQAGGSLSPTAQSFVGIELRIPWSRKKITVLHSTGPVWTSSKPGFGG